MRNISSKWFLCPFNGYRAYTGVIILPTQTRHYLYLWEIPQNYNTFALFDSPEMGNLIIPVIHIKVQYHQHLISHWAQPANICANFSLITGCSMRGLPKTWRISIPERQPMESWAVWGKMKGNRTPDCGGGSSVSTSKPRSEQETLEEIPLFLPTEEFQHILNSGRILLY